MSTKMISLISGLQDELGFKVLDYIERMPIRIIFLLLARMYFSNPNSSFMAAVVIFIL